MLNSAPETPMEVGKTWTFQEPSWESFQCLKLMLSWRHKFKTPNVQGKYAQRYTLWATHIESEVSIASVLLLIDKFRAKSNRVNHYPPWISIFETTTPGGQSGMTCPSMPSWCLMSEVCGIFWSCPYVALAAKDIWKVPTRSMFGGTFRYVVRFLVGNDQIQFVCHNFVCRILDWFHQGGPTQRWSEAMDSMVAKESSNPNLSVSQEGEWNVSVFISFWTLPCLVQAYFLLKV